MNIILFILKVDRIDIKSVVGNSSGRGLLTMLKRMKLLKASDVGREFKRYSDDRYRIRINFTC